MLFVGAKVSHFALLPQGQPERTAARPRDGADKWTRKASATARNHYECEAVCPAEIKATFIAKLNREYRDCKREGVLFGKRKVTGRSRCIAAGAV